MAAKAGKNYALPALVSEGLGLGNQQGGNWLAVPVIENQRDNYQLNRLPTYSTNVVGFPLNEKDIKFIGGTGFSACDRGSYAIAPNPVV